MTTIHKISTYLLIAMGVIHISLTPVLYGKLVFPTLWFIAGGMVMIFLGFLNVGLTRKGESDNLARVLCQVANGMTTIFGVMAVWLAPQPHIIFIFVLLVSITVTSFFAKR